MGVELNHNEITIACCSYQDSSLDLQNINCKVSLCQGFFFQRNITVIESLTLVVTVITDAA